MTGEKKIIKDKKGRFAKGTCTNPEIKNKYEDDTLYKHELNEIKMIESSRKLSFLDRGRKYLEFKTKWELSDKLVGKEFGVERCTVSKDIRNYKTAKDIGIDKVKSFDAPDRVLMAGLELKDTDKSLNFIENYKNYSLDIEEQIRLLKGTITADDLKLKLKKEYDVKVAEIDKFMREMVNTDE